MNREILFRGKRVDNGEWVEGSYLYYSDVIVFEIEEQPGIFKNVEYEVVEETVGQFTGLTDKNGTKIFEGDRVKADIGDLRITGMGFTVVYHEDGFSVVAMKHVVPLRLSDIENIQVTGNIHDK